MLMKFISIGPKTTSEVNSVLKNMKTCKEDEILFAKDRPDIIFDSMIPEVLVVVRIENYSSSQKDRFFILFKYFCFSTF